MGTLALARGTATRHGGRVTLTHHSRTAVAGADAVYADTWVSMGDEAEGLERRRVFANYRVDQALKARAAPNGAP